MFNKKGKLLSPEALAKGKQERENKEKADNLKKYLNKLEELANLHGLSLAEFKLANQILISKYQDKAEKGYKIEIEVI